MTGESQHNSNARVSHCVIKSHTMSQNPTSKQAVLDEIARLTAEINRAETRRKRTARNRTWHRDSTTNSLAPPPVAAKRTLTKKKKAVRHVQIGGEQFAIDASRTSLVRISPSTASNNLTPNVVINGVPFVRGKGGNLVRESQVRQVAKWTQPFCQAYLLGTCTRGAKCRYMHRGPHGCPRFASTRNCTDRTCPHLHLDIQQTSCFCSLFQNDRCKQGVACSFLHVKSAKDIEVCPVFARNGYCLLGINCPKRHLFTCPQFEATGVCSDVACPLPHRQRRTNQEVLTEEQPDNGSESDSQVSKVSFSAEPIYIDLEWESD